MLPLTGPKKVHLPNITANSPVKKTGIPKLQCIFLGFKYSTAFFSSVHLSSRCPITSEPGLLNATQTDSQEACLLNRVLATSYPRNYRFLAAQEEWRKCSVGFLYQILAPLFAPDQEKKKKFKCILFQTN